MVNQYQVLELLGEGSFGVVRAGLDITTKTPVAIKKMSKGRLKRDVGASGETLLRRVRKGLEAGETRFSSFLSLHSFLFILFSSFLSHTPFPSFFFFSPESVAPERSGTHPSPRRPQNRLHVRRLINFDLIFRGFADLRSDPAEKIKFF
jgi:hypothetical protein